MEERKAWDIPDDFERYPKLNDELRKKGDIAIVKFLNDGKTVKVEDMTAETLASLKEKGIRPRDNVVFLVESKEGEKREFWIGAKNYTNLRELKKIALDNNGTLVNAMVKIERIAEKSPTEPNFRFEKYEA